MSYIRYVIGVDPSGSFNEGKGTTGIAVYDIKKDKIVEIRTVCATKYNCLEQYIDANWQVLNELCSDYTSTKERAMVCIEDFLVYAANATAFTHSKMETCQLLGHLKTQMWRWEIPYLIEPASAVKTRWSNDILVYKGYVEQKGKSYYHPCIRGPLATHMLDAIRHAVHCGKFGVTSYET